MTNLKRIIDEKGVQQRWLAEQVGVTEVSMSRYVNGGRIPKAPMAIRMADVLGVDVKDLYGWDDAHVIGENEAQPETHDKRTETHACDCISRKAAIEALQEHRNLFCDNTPETFSKLSYAEKSRVDELDMAIATLINLPSAQPDSKELSFTQKKLDTISRQAAIDEIEERKTANGYRNVAVISELNRLEGYIMRLPSVQPETHEKRTKTHSCDCISRQAAISVIAKWMLEYGGEGEEHERNALKQAAEEIKDLPSAQPEIIRCKECVYFFDDFFHCDRVTWYNEKDDFCSKAKRRTYE